MAPAGGRACVVVQVFPGKVPQYVVHPPAPVVDLLDQTAVLQPGCALAAALLVGFPDVGQRVQPEFIGGKDTQSGDALLIGLVQFVVAQVKGNPHTQVGAVVPVQDFSPTAGQLRQQVGQGLFGRAAPFQAFTGIGPGQNQRQGNGLHRGHNFGKQRSLGVGYGLPHLPAQECGPGLRREGAHSVYGAIRQHIAPSAGYE